jgi:hypothetical protein
MDHGYAYEAMTVRRPIRRGAPDESRQGLGQTPPAVLAVAQLLFSLFSVIDIDATLKRRKTTSIGRVHWKSLQT